MSAVAADEGFFGGGSDEGFEAEGAGAVLAGRHHAGVAGRGKLAVAEAALQILSAHFFLIIISNNYNQSLACVLKSNTRPAIGAGLYFHFQ